MHNSLIFIYFYFLSRSLQKICNQLSELKFFERNETKRNATVRGKKIETYYGNNQAIQTR